jgi:hypothetical protein
MSIQISFGHLSQYLDCFEANEIELNEEKDLETEEKEKSEESEKENLLVQLIYHSMLNKEILHCSLSLDLKCKSILSEIPTPPPRLRLQA